jgi:NAD(P)-dependent dehydrogenase (short-subunit alcohol dehydrogenase family)
VAIITGGGTGIGLAIGEEYARLGAKLVLASRNPGHLEPAAQELLAKPLLGFLLDRLA